MIIGLIVGFLLGALAVSFLLLRRENEMDELLDAVSEVRDALSVRVRTEVETEHLERIREAVDRSADDRP